MIISAQNAHDYYFAASTVIPILILAQFAFERSPIEVSALDYQDSADQLRSGELEALRHARLLRPEQRASWLQRMRALTRVGKSEQVKLRAEQESIKEQLKVYAEMNKEFRVGYERVALRFHRRAIIVAALLILAGLIGEFFALLGLLGAIDEFYAIAVSLSSIWFILAMLIQMVLFRLLRTLSDFDLASQGIFIVSFFSAHTYTDSIYRNRDYPNLRHAIGAQLNVKLSLTVN